MDTPAPTSHAEPPAQQAPAHQPVDSSARTRQRLIGLNVALLLMLGVVTILTSVDAGAQPGATPAAPRPRGDYTVVSGRYQGGVGNAVFFLDAANQELLAVSWDRARNELEIIGHRKLGDDAQLKPGR